VAGLRIGKRDRRLWPSLLRLCDRRTCGVAAGQEESASPSRGTLRIWPHRTAHRPFGDSDASARSRESRIGTKWSQSGRSDRRFRSAHTRRPRTDEEGCSTGEPPARRARAYRTIRPSSGRPAPPARRFGPLARRGPPPRRMRSRARRSIPLRLAHDGSDQSGRGRPAVPQAASPP
jgi:hypothetical protein